MLADQIMAKNPSIKDSNQINTSSTRTNKLIWLFTILMGIITIFLLPFYNQQTLAAALLDKSGKHEAALKYDVFINNPGSAFWLNGVDYTKPDTCSKIWDNIKNQSYEVKNVSISENANIVISYLDQKVANLNSTFNVSTDLENAKGEVYVPLMLDIGSSALEQAVQAIYPSASEEVKQKIDSDIKAQIFAGAFVNLEKVGFWVNQINFTDKNLDYSGTFTDKNIYGQELKLTDDQKNFYKKLSNYLSSLTNTQPSQLLSDDNGKKIAQVWCKNVESIKVGDLEPFDNGVTSNQKLRKIEIRYKQDSSLPTDDIKNILNDTKIDTFLKAQYPAIKELEYSYNKAYNSNLGLTQDQFNQGVESFLQGMRDNISSQSMSSDTQVVKVSNNTTDYFVNSEGKLTTIKETMQIQPNVEEIKKIVGVSNTEINYDNLKNLTIQLDSQTIINSLNKGTKLESDEFQLSPINKFTSDVQQTDKYGELQKELDRIFNGSSSIQ